MASAVVPGPLLTQCVTLHFAPLYSPHQQHCTPRTRLYFQINISEYYCWHFNGINFGISSKRRFCVCCRKYSVECTINMPYLWPSEYEYFEHKNTFSKLTFTDHSSVSRELKYRWSCRQLFLRYFIELSDYFLWWKLRRICYQKLVPQGYVG